MNFDFGNVLIRAWQIPWKHKSILALLLLPMLLAFLFLPFFIIPIFSLNGNDGFVFTDIAGNVLILAFSIFTGVAWLFFYVLAIIFRSSAILGVVRAERNEGTLLFLELLRDAVQYFWRILGVTLILGLTVGLAFSVFFMVVFVLTMVTMGIASICLQPIMIFLTPLTFLVIALMEGAQTAVISEDVGSWDAIKRAFHVIREHVWKYVIITLVIYFASAILSGFLVIPFMAPVFFVPFALETGVGPNSNSVFAILIGFMLLFFPIMIIVQSILSAWMKVALDLTYLRLTRITENQVVFVEEQA